MYKKSIGTILFLLILGVSVYTQEKCEKFTDGALGVSFCVPSGWKSEDNPQVGKVVYGKRSNGLSPILFIRSMIYPGAVAEAADLSNKVTLKTKPELADRFELSSKTSFTVGEHRGVKLVYKIVGFQNGEMKTVQYFFSAKGDYKVAITATFYWTDTKSEESVEDAVKTLALEK